MIVVVRRNNIILIALIFLLSVALYSLNVGTHEAAPASGEPAAQKVVMLDAGHGGEDPGAVSDYSGLKEKDVNLNIVLKLKELLEGENYKVILTREEDRLEYSDGTTNIIQKRKQDLLRRKKMMDEGGADIVISVHLNKFPQTQYYGAQTFFPPGCSDSQKLAMSLQKAIKESIDPDNKREALPKLVNGKPIIILKEHKTTTAIVECGFLSNEEEEKKLASEEYQIKLAEAIRDGIKMYFKK